MQIFAHISGPTGSGKTTLGKLLKDKYPNIIIKDLDDFYRESIKTSEDSMNKKKLYKIISKKINDFCKKNKESNIIFVGANAVSTKKDFSDASYYDINAKYKYFIDIEMDVILERRFKRHIQYMNDNIDHYFDKIMKRGQLIIDLNMWKKKIKEPYNSGYYKKNNYIFLDNDKIFKEIQNNLKKN
jgi:adenylate kinase family enzyme